MQYKKILLVIFSICALIFIERFCHKKTEGFAFHKIQSNGYFDPKWETHIIPTQEEQKILSLCDQPFYFLKSGGQSYAFISQDGKYVLKFFKMHHMREIPWLKKVKFSGVMEKLRKKIIRFRENKLHYIFESSKIAYEEFQEETALLYLHLNPTEHLKKKIVIYDKIGIRHEVDVDQTPFLLQEKVDLVFAKFHELMKNEDIPAAKECIENLLTLFLKKYEKGIDDHDPVIRKNFGFIGTKAVEIDLGSFSKKENVRETSPYKPKLLRELKVFSRWIEEFYPVLSPFVEEKMKAILEE